MTTWADAGGNRLGDITTDTYEFAREVFVAAQGAGHDVWWVWGWGPNPEHNSRCAIDFMVRSQAAGDWVRGYIWAHRVRLGLRHVIWWQRITSTVNEPGKVRLMGDRGTATANHYDHVHALRHNQPLGRPPAAPLIPKGEEVKIIIGYVKGRATAWSGLRGLVPLQPHSRPKAIDALVAAGAVQFVFDTPSELVEAMGLIYGLDWDQTVAEVGEAG